MRWFKTSELRKIEEKAPCFSAGRTSEATTRNRGTNTEHIAVREGGFEGVVSNISTIFENIDTRCDSILSEEHPGKTGLLTFEQLERIPNCGRSVDCYRQFPAAGCSSGNAEQSHPEVHRIGLGTQVDKIHRLDEQT